MGTCQRILPWNPRTHAVMGEPHDHRCKLELGHPVREATGVQVHECSECWLCWESDRRPLIYCTCAVERNPSCPVHGGNSL